MRIHVSATRRGWRLAVVGLLLAAACVVGVSSASAQGTLDQVNNSTALGSTGFSGTNDSSGQVFTAGLTGALDTVQVPLCKGGNPGDLVVKIEGTTTNALFNPPIQVPDDSNVLATQSVPSSSVTVPCSSSAFGAVTVPFDNPASVQAGTAYTLVLSAPDAPTFSDFYSTSLTADTYSGGQWCTFSTSWICDLFGAPDTDSTFATFVTVPSAGPSADVAVSISGPASAKKGAQVTYVITVSNAGPSVAHNVVLSDPLPSGASFVAVGVTNGTCSHPKVGSSKGAISCSLGDLASGGSVGGTTTIKITAKIGSTIANLVSAYSTADGGPATPDPDTSNNIASVSTQITK